MFSPAKAIASMVTMTARIPSEALRCALGKSLRLRTKKNHKTGSAASRSVSIQGRVRSKGIMRQNVAVKFDLGKNASLVKQPFGNQ